MKFIFTLFLLSIIAFISTKCKSYPSTQSSCLENPDSNSTLLVIVGEKLSIREEQQPPDSSLSLHYAKFTAHYRILEKVCGDYQQDTISFTAYDHYGFPSFGKYQYVLLYLNITKEGIFHEIYLHSPLYKTKDDRWASPYSMLDFKRGHDGITVEPQKIDFVQEISFSVEGFTRAKTQKWYPEPYYRIDKVNKKAIAVMGNYVPELFQLQKETVLHSRGIYGTKGEIKPNEIELEYPELIPLSKKDSLELLKTWKLLIKSIKANDIVTIKSVSLDSIYCSACEGMPRAEYENNLESIDMFIDSAKLNLQRSALWSIIEKNKYKISVTKYPESKPATFKLKEGDKFIIYSISFKNELITKESTYWIDHSFEFVKPDDQFRFYSMHSYWSTMRDNK